VSEHPSDHLELLAELLAGERGADEPEVERRLRECEPCRLRWRALRETAARVGRAGAEQRAVLEELPRAGAAAGEERVLATLARLSQDRTARPAPSRRVVPWLAAAAVLLVAGAWVFFGRGERPDPTWLGPRPLELVAPLEGASNFETFSWTYSGGDAAGFTLRVFRPEDGLEGEPLVTIERMKESTWTPDAELLRELPEQILWQVEVLDEFQLVRASASASASRSSR